MALLVPRPDDGVSDFASQTMGRFIQLGQSETPVVHEVLDIDTQLSHLGTLESSDQIDHMRDSFQHRTGRFSYLVMQAFHLLRRTRYTGSNSKQVHR